MKIDNLKLKNNSFQLFFYSNKGNQYIESGETIETMIDTINHYKRKYRLTRIELLQQQGRVTQVIELASCLPF
jgi:hypothetical protein